MRVTGRRTTGTGERRGGNRANSSEALAPIVSYRSLIAVGCVADGKGTDTLKRPRADSAPARGRLDIPLGANTGTSLRVGNLAAVPTELVIPETAISISGTSNELDGEGQGEEPISPVAAWDGEAGGMATSGRPYQFAATALDAALGDPAMLGQTLLDEGSDVDDELDLFGDGESDGDLLRTSRDSRRSSHAPIEAPLSFAAQPIAPRIVSRPSALTSALNKHVPHLVTTSTPHNPFSPSSPSSSLPQAGPSNPFAALYTSVAAPPGVPNQRIELYFPHSDEPTTPLIVTVRNDATVEEVTGYGLYRYWEEGREPAVSNEDGVSWETVGWGLRIVEDDGEVDEDFPRKLYGIFWAGRRWPCPVKEARI